MGYDVLSGTTKGKCISCKIVWYWKTGSRRLYDTRCPVCNRPLRATTYLMKRYTWRPLLEQKRKET